VSIVATALSYFISYLLILHTSKGFQSLFYILITLPFLANESVRVFSWQYVLAENGVFNQFLSAISGSSVHFFDGSNAANVYLTMVVTCIPFGIFINSAALLTIPAIYWRVADDLKLNHLTKLIKIALPLSTFAIISALITIFFVAFSLSAEVNFLGGDSKISMRNFVLSLMSASRFQAVFSLGCFVLLLLGVFMLFYTYFNRSKQ
jgi:ABC-type spermidine/putrescine transport system permease subunit I